MKKNILWNKLGTKTLLGLGLLGLTGCSHISMAQQKHCVEPTELYKAADMRQVKQGVFAQAISCENPETIKVALIALGRIGGQGAADLIKPQISHEDSRVRETAAFAAGISLSPQLVPLLAEQFDKETDKDVQERLALAIGNLGHDKSAEALYSIINNTKSDQAARGAMQGLGILALFHRDKLTNKQNLKVDKVIEYLAKPATSLQASFLLARVPLMNSDHIQKVMGITDKLDNDSQGYAIRAIGNLKPKEQFDWFYQKAQSDDIGIRVSAIQALGKLPIGDKDQVAKINGLATSKDLISSLTALQSAKKWMILDNLNKLVASENSWIQSQAFDAANNPKPEAMQKLAQQWLDSDSPNLQRAAIGFYAEQNDKDRLEALAKSDKVIIATGAQQKLGSYQAPESAPQPTSVTLPSLPRQMTLVTSKGKILVKLFSDTPYTSANFVKLAKEGFYDGTYFHRVIPNFVAQGGGKHGDGSGTVGYSIREELNSRSHRYGTLGMATAGKDTGGGQFFINLAPNLHLDSNYTIFGEVITGMDVALKLEQNDQILEIK
ncbi:MAG: peptidylprolyl isomerase [Gammaproteobacteria bacterium]|nr:peptidylprolyl isomerase [Gammaproteobacteria bacterium]